MNQGNSAILTTVVGQRSLTLLITRKIQLSAPGSYATQNYFLIAESTLILCRCCLQNFMKISQLVLVHLIV